MRQPVTFPTGRGLVVPKVLGPAKSEQQQLHNKWDTIEGVEEELMKTGLVPPVAMPYAYPGLVTPEQLTNQNSAEYTTLYSQHLGWFNFVSIAHARVKARLVQIENEMDDIARTIRQEIRDRNRTVPKKDQPNATEVQDTVKSNPRYQQLLLEQQAFEQKKIEFDAYVESMDRNLKAISRQVEIRRQEIEGSRMEGNMPGRNHAGVRR